MPSAKAGNQSRTVLLNTYNTSTHPNIRSGIFRDFQRVGEELLRTGELTPYAKVGPTFTRLVSVRRGSGIQV
jgi:hypothetical protein